MTMTTTRTIAGSDIDPFSAEFLSDPYPFYAALRAAGQIVWLERIGVWAVARHADVHAILQDWQGFCNSGGGGLANYHKEKPWRPPSLILEADPPLHTRTRAVLTRLMSPKALRELRDVFAGTADELVGRLVRQKHFEVVVDLAQAFAKSALPDCVGLPPDERDMLILYGRMVASGFGAHNHRYEQAMAQADIVVPWITSRCRREALAAGGFGAQIYAAADAGELTEEEAGLLVRSFLSAGVNTTVNSIGFTLFCLADNPDQWRKLRDDPTLARAAFEEAVRFEQADQGLYRTTTSDLDYAGVRLAQHDKVLLLVGSANRDPQRWDDPDRYDIQRKTIGHVGFGTGLHGCVAQMLARLEGEAVIGAIARQVDDLRFDGKAERHIAGGSRSMARIPLAVTAKAA